MPIDSLDPSVWTATLLMLSVLGLYFATRMALRAAIPQGMTSAGRRAWCQWMPIGVTSLAASFLKLPGVALAIVIGTSVAYLSLVFGMATYVSPMNASSPRPKIWGFVLVPILLVLLAGTGGTLTGWHAAMLLGFGVVLLLVWRDEPRGNENSLFASRPGADPAAIAPMQWVQIVFAILLSAVAGVAAVHATTAAAQQAGLSSDVLATLRVLCPMLTLPSLRSSVSVAERGDVNGAVSALVGTVLLNFCLLLPMIVLLWYPIMSPGFNSFSTLPPAPAGNYCLPLADMGYSGRLWQLETVALVTIGFAFVPISLGKITLTRISSAVFILAYAAYLAIIAWPERG